MRATSGSFLLRKSGSLKRLLRCTRGTSFVEFSLVMPLLLLLLGGVTEFGRALYHHHVLETSLRNATRYLARTGTVGQDPDNPCSNATDTSAHQARLLAIYGTVDGSGDPLLPYMTKDDLSVVCIRTRTASVTTAAGGTLLVPVVGMDIRITYEDIGLLALMGLDELTLFAQHEETHIGE